MNKIGSVALLATDDEVNSLRGPLRHFVNNAIRRFVELRIPDRPTNWYIPTAGIGYEIEPRSEPDLSRLEFELYSHAVDINGFEELRDLIVRSPGLCDYFCRDGMGNQVDPPHEHSLRQRLLQFTWGVATRSYLSTRGLIDLEIGFNDAYDKLKGELQSSELVRLILALLYRTRVEGHFELGSGSLIRRTSLAERNELIRRSGTLFGVPTPLDSTIRPILHSEALAEIRVNGPRSLKWSMRDDSLMDQLLSSIRIDPGVSAPVISTYLMLDSICYAFGTGVIRRAEPLPQMDWQTLDLTSLDEARDILKALQVSPNRQFVGTAIRRLNSGLMRVSAEDAFIDYMVGIESLMTDRNQSGEITYKISMRTAAMIGSNGAERNAIKRDVAELYGKRSSVLHGGAKKSDLKADSTRLNMYLRRLIMAVLSMNEPFEAKQADSRLLSGDEQDEIPSRSAE